VNASAAENAWMRVVRVCAHFQQRCDSDQYIYHIYRYNAPRLGLVHRVCASAHELVELRL
jgi:hypothetical protein